jgi:hypothetical protein
MIIEDKVNVKLFAPGNHRIQKGKTQRIKCKGRAAGCHSVHIDRQPDNITPQAFNIYDILFCKSGELDFSGIAYLKPYAKVYSPTEGSLRTCGYEK